MKVLAFDTSSVVGLVGVLVDGRLVSSEEWRREGSHGEHLTSAIETCLAKASLALSGVDAIAVGVGPGSFTGARIAVNAARTLAFAAGKPCLTFNASELMAASVGLPTAGQPGRLCVLLDAQKNEVFVSLFEAVDGEWRQTLVPQVATADTVASFLTSPRLCVGDGYQVLVDEDIVVSELLRDPNLSDEPSAKALANLKIEMRQPLDWKEVQALYIKASGAEQKLGEGLGKKG